MRRRFFLFLFLCVALPAVLFAAGAEDDKPTVAGITLTASGGRLLLAAAVKNSFTKEMLEGVQNGIPVIFRFTMKLERVRSYWFNKELAALDISHTLSYDPIRREYQIVFSEKKQPHSTRSLSEAQRLMAELKGLEIAKLDQLAAGSGCALHIKATLAENTFPLGLHMIIPFTSLWNIETDWRTVEFTY
ncbi:DUF4390 domain-containing protein [Candidatus Electronema sp. JM]|uniref:DUF4390 domain-containing protein n=1 Tax=Candidatus Electronema sp. JM TaxID=3401571 RepID=UPI003AA8391F